jgi:hypothetical protein
MGDFSGRVFTEEGAALLARRAKLSSDPRLHFFVLCQPALREMVHAKQKWSIRTWDFACHSPPAIHRSTLLNLGGAVVVTSPPHAKTKSKSNPALDGPRFTRANVFCGWHCF